ncbi:MAG: molybdopterin-synthase adenylyltransferase MoeB [Verrucomicrobiota bacterium]
MEPKEMVPPWRTSLLERAKCLELRPEEIRRYSRHLLIPEVTVEGQKQIKAARVLVVGAGGLGSPVLAYLAAAGVGTLGIVDFDQVSLSNLQRQILHSDRTVGKSKVESAEAFIRDRNPWTEVEAITQPFGLDNAEELVGRYDLVVDGTDNFATRYLINDSCFFAGKPYVYGSIFRFYGQVSVFGLADGPCYRCLQPEPPDPGTVPTCAEGGVFGVLAGLIGSLQAAEALKLICNLGRPMSGKLLVAELASAKFKEVRIRKDPECSLCGKQPTITSLKQTAETCDLATPETSSHLASNDILPQDLQSAMESQQPPVILDVRNPEELRINRIPSAISFPLTELTERLHSLDSARAYVVVCKGDQRTRKAIQLLRDAGFQRVQALAGGIDAWVEEVDPSQPLY